jgi:geranylgeranyl diphosphate synthase type 3
MNVHHGQGLDIYWRDYLKDLEHLPEIEDYLGMVKDKTGSLFRLAIKLLLLHSDVGEDNGLVAIANLLGIIYQIRDDYLNLVDIKYSAMKGVTCEDLIEGKLSLPILHCLRTTTNSPVHEILYNYNTSAERAKQNALIEECLTYMKNKSRSLQYTLDLIKTLERKIKAMMTKYPNLENSGLIKIIDRLCDL